MQWFTNLMTRTKLFLAFGTMLVMLGIVIVFSYDAIDRVRENEQELFDHNYASAVAIKDIRISHLAARMEGLNMLVTRDRDTLLAQKKAGNEQVAACKGLMVRLIEKNQAFPAIHTQLLELQKRLDEYETIRSTQTLPTILAGNFASAAEIIQSVQDNHTDAIASLVQELDNEFAKEGAATLQSSGQIVSFSFRTLAAIGCMGILLVLVIVFGLDHLIATPLTEVVQMIQAMAQGNLDRRLDLARRDEFGSLGTAMNGLAETIQAMVGEARRLSEAAVQGRLSTRGDAHRFDGAYREIVQGVNATLDAVIGPLNMAATTLDRIAQDIIPLPITDRYNGDFELLKNNLNKMITNLRSLNQEMRNGFSVMASASTEILATVSQVAASATEVVTAVSETSTTAEEVKQTAQVSNQKARNVQEGAQRTATVSEAGRKAVSETIEGMNHIREQMESIAESIVALSERSQAIGEIIATVNDLAEQSNLLAVNAAIEATRAGEFGKGFGVVAQEVKSLAEQSRQATTQVRTILMEVQKATSAAVMATEQGTKAVTAGLKQATEAGESIRLLATNVQEAAQAATQIAASSQQQVIGMDQIATAIANIKQATTQNMTGTKQLETSAQNLQDLGGRLRPLVERQKLEG